MKNKLVAGLLLSALMGCSKEPAKSPGNTADRQGSVSGASVIDPGLFTVVETAEAREWKEIQTRARDLLTAKKYESLEELAREYRNSKERYADGVSRLGKVYGGFDLGGQASDKEWNSELDMLRHWVQTRPNSITARVALGNGLIGYAWKARGDGSANTVTDEGWKLFGTRLTEAAQVLEDAGSLSEHCPRRSSLLMEAYMGLGVERAQYEALFQKAINSEPGYDGYYFAKAYYLMPRWYGKPGELEEFIVKTADGLGGDDGDVLYAQIAWYLQKSMGGNIFVTSELSWERVDKGLRILEQRFPDSLYLKNARAYLTLMGSLSGDDWYRRIVELNGKIDPVIWTSKENFIRLTKNLQRQ